MSGWHTKSDIIRDLAKVTNGIVDNDIDDSYIVIGNEKPKPRIEDELYDEDPRFEGADLNYQSGQTPNLDGIKKMLRMCSEYEEMQERERGVEASGGDGIPYVISKLDPLTAPFQPRAPAAPGGAAPAAPTAGRLAREQEIRSKIDQASLDNSRKGRTQKNVAIASLLKLYSESASGARDHSGGVRDQQPVRAEDHSVSESIEKVNSWLNGDHRTAASPTPKSPVPVEQSMFKRKQAKSTKSTASSESNVKKQPANVAKAYKPSDYAENLRSRYIENNKPKKQPIENVWEKLERELKEKDEKIMRDRLNTERLSGSGADNTVS